jgi:hypothetical protein
MHKKPGNHPFKGGLFFHDITSHSYIHTAQRKVNARLSALGLRRVRLELPEPSRNPRGHQPADLLALRSCVLPSTTGWAAGPVGHA